MYSVGNLALRYLLFALFSIGAAAMLPSSSRAQLVADGATNILDGVPTNIAGDITVGTNGSFTLLVLTNSASITNTGSAYIGSSAAAKSNSVVLTGIGSGWTNPGSFVVGVSGSYNQLSILDGAVVSNYSS